MWYEKYEIQDRKKKLNAAKRRQNLKKCISGNCRYNWIIGAGGGRCLYNGQYHGCYGTVPSGGRCKGSLFPYSMRRKGVKALKNTFHR